MSWLSGNQTATEFTKPNPFNLETGYHHQISESEHLEEELHHLQPSEEIDLYHQKYRTSD